MEIKKSSNAISEAEEPEFESIDLFRRKLDVLYETNEKVCRICCKCGDISLFSGLGDKTIADNINTLSDITITQSDGFPQWLCRNCLRLLKHAIKFRKLAQSSTRKLIKMKQVYSDDKSSLQLLEVPVIKYEQSEYPLCELDCPIQDTCLPRETGDTEEIRLGSCTPSPQHSLKKEEESQEEIPSEYNQNYDAQDSDMTDTKLQQDENDNPPYRKRRRRKKPPEGPFLCDICGKSLGKLHSLAVHMTTHSNVFPFKCGSCDYRGRTKDLLKVHLRTHLAVRPFGCPQCPLRFLTASNLAKHKKRHEQQTPQECAQCGKLFANKVSLARHIRDIHVGAPPVYCEVCGRRFTRQKNLHKHRTKAHNMKAERTGRWPAYLLCRPDDTSDNPTDCADHPTDCADHPNCTDQTTDRFDHRTDCADPPNIDRCDGPVDSIRPTVYL